MARRRAPVHPRGEVIREPAPRRGRTIAILGGAALLATGMIAGAFMVRGGGESANTAGAGRGSVPATASPFPQETTAPRPTISTSPSERVTPASPTPEDKGYGDRRSASERYDRCNVASFTNNGILKGNVVLNLDVVFESDPTSTEVRSHGESKNLHWDNPVVVAVPLDAKGLPTDKNVLTFPAKTDKVDGHTTITMPKNTATDTKYGIGVVTNAFTPYGGGEMESRTVTYCDTIVNEGDNHWNKSVEEPVVPLITTVDIYHD